MGSISFSYVVAKHVAGIDIRQHGSKNAGATNTLRVLGKGPAILVLILDMVKAIIPILILMFFTDQPFYFILAGLFAIIGHNWPIFFGFKGGKGVATTIGVVLTLFFVPGVVAGLIAILVIIFFKYVSLGSIVFVTLLPIIMLIFQSPTEYLVGAIVILLLTYVRHRANLVRLLQGEESKIGKIRADGEER